MFKKIIDLIRVNVIRNLFVLIKSNLKTNKKAIGIGLFFLTIFSFNFFLIKSNPLSSIFGIPLVLFFPGFFLNQLLFPHKKRWLEVISLSSMTSIILITALLLIMRPILQASSLYLVLLIANILALVASLFNNQHNDKATELPQTKNNWELVVVFLLPVMLFILNYAISPYINEGDSFYFIYAIKDSLKAGLDVGPYNTRSAVVPFSAVFIVLCKLSYNVLFKIIWSSIFYINSLFVLGFCIDKIKDRYLAYLTYLSFLAIPVVTTEVDIGRPQTLLLSFTAPILLINIQSILSKNYTGSIITLIFSIILTRYHELSFVLILISIISLLITFIKKNKAASVSSKLKLCLILLIVIFPYIKLVMQSESNEIMARTINSLIGSLLHPTWKWWFINSYSTTDGYELGWKGIQAVYYYLYNSIQVIVLLFVTIFLSKKKLTNEILPIVFFVSLYFVVAEILPRLGFFFMPNRAWPHLMLGVWLLIIIFTSQLNSISNKKKFILSSFMISLIILGTGAWFKITSNKGGFYSKKDINLTHYLEGLPDNSVILTSQDPNRGLIEVYSNRRMEDLHYFNYSTIDLDKIVDESIKYLNNDIELKESAKIITTTVEINGEIIDKDTKITKGKKFVREKVTSQPVYVLYSFSKFEGMFGAREWWQQINDLKHRDFYESLRADSRVAYQDQAAILVRIK